MFGSISGRRRYDVGGSFNSGKPKLSMLALAATYERYDNNHLCSNKL